MQSVRTSSFLVLFFMLIGIKSHSQSLKTIEKIEKSYQECLDSGNNMRGCSINYYTKADSLLNVVYQKKREKRTDLEKNNLKKEQLKWLKKRDLYFKKEYSNLKKEDLVMEGSTDFDMIYYDRKASFVMKRVKELINRF